MLVSGAALLCRGPCSNKYTPEYAAPEALRYGTAKAHAPADIWAVGVTLLELLLGRLPAFAV
eukprot:1159993-Pelagomonas_calceolata.AAC.2